MAQAHASAFVRTAAVFAAVSVLAACGGSGDDSASGDEGPVTITIQSDGSGSQIPDNDVIKQQLDKKLGADVKLNTGTTGDEYTNQLVASMAGGNPPDLFQVDRNRLQQFVKQGLVLDLTDHLKSDLGQYGKAVPEELGKIATFDDKVYGIVKRRSYNYNSYWIRKDWLDKLGLPMPKTADDFSAVLKAFTEDDPDGNGKNDTYGLTGGNDSALWATPWAPLWGAFGSAGPTSLYLKEGRIVSGYDDPATQDALAYISDLVKAKVVDPDFASSNALQAHERALQGKAGVIAMDWPRMTKPEFVQQYKKAQPTAEWVQLGAPSGPAGAGKVPVDTNATTIYALPRELEDDKERLAKVFELINYVSSDEGNRLVSYGIEGEHYKLAGNKVQPTDKLATEGEYFWLYQVTGRDEGAYLATKFTAQLPYIDYAEKQPSVEIFNSLVVNPQGYNASDGQRFASEQLAQFISGKRPMSEYGEFRDTLWKQFGYQAYVDSATQQLRELGVGK